MIQRLFNERKNGINMNASHNFILQLPKAFAQKFKKDKRRKKK